MANHGSAKAREHTPHANRTTRTNTIVNALKQRAQAVLNDETLDPESRAKIRHALETNDPWLAEMVRRADGTTETDHANSSREKIEALAEIICSGGDKPAAALLVLMGTIQNSTEPTALAHTVKHFAFTRCGELNVNGMVDA
jgi:vacuolar-type H+-ATPase subunit H